MHAYIITGGTTDERSEHIKKMLADRLISSHDVISVLPEPPEKKRYKDSEDVMAIRIDPIRQAEKVLYFAPVTGNARAMVIREAHTMNIPAQNAFLKTLEEPPGDALILLETTQPDALLPTVLSRCHTIRLPDRARPCQSDDVTIASLKTFMQLVDASIGKRLNMIDAITKTRSDALTFVTHTIHGLAACLRLTRRGPVIFSMDTTLDIPPAAMTRLLRSLLTAHNQLQGNINPKLVLDNVFLSPA